MRIRTLAILLLFCSLAASVEAYELTTHARTTNSAYAQSRLGSDVNLTWVLGIESWTFPGTTLADPFATSSGDIYFDMEGATIHARQLHSYDLKVVRDAGLQSQSRGVNGWLMRGAIREDDGGTSAGKLKGEPADMIPTGALTDFAVIFSRHSPKRRQRLHRILLFS